MQMQLGSSQVPDVAVSHRCKSVSNKRGSDQMTWVEKPHDQKNKSATTKMPMHWYCHHWFSVILCLSSTNPIGISWSDQVGPCKKLDCQFV